LETEQDQRKENTLNTERWNDRGALANTATYTVQKPAPRPTAPAAFAVFVNEECVAMHEHKEDERRRQGEHHRQARDERNFLRKREHVDLAEKLTSDPLRYVRNPDQLETDRAHATTTEATSAFTAKQARDKKSKTRLNEQLERLLKKPQTTFSPTLHQFFKRK